jgi:aryl-phospho-beta-D-glucosidase BglC (GH1 family)
MRYYRLKSIGILFIICMISLMISNVFTYADETPPRWPWNGLTIPSIGTTASDVAYIVEKLSINSLRLTLRPRQLALKENIPPKIAWEKTMLWLEEMLNACKYHNLTCIPSLSQIPIDPGLSVTESDPEFWKEEKYHSRAIYLAGDIAKRFRGRGSELGAYQILNEPLEKGILLRRPKNWPKIIRNIISEIRKHDQKRYITVAAGPGGLPTGYDDFEPINSPNIIYTFHYYIPHIFTHQGIEDKRLLEDSYPGYINGKFYNRDVLASFLHKLHDFQLNNSNPPVWVSEFSVVRWAKGSETYLQDLASIFKAYGWGYSYHSWGGYFWNPLLDNVYRKFSYRESENYIKSENSKRFRMLRNMFSKD